MPRQHSRMMPILPPSSVPSLSSRCCSLAFSLTQPPSVRLLCRCQITSHRFFIVTLTPTLNSDTALHVAETTRSRPAKLVLGHLFQMTECTLSLLFCVFPSLQRSSRSMCASRVYTPLTCSATSDESGVPTFVRCGPGSCPVASAFW